MTPEEFKTWLRTEYRPPTEVDEQDGGYLVPHYITADKKGWIAAACRWVGYILRNRRIYTLGTYQYDLYAALTRKVKQ